MKIFWIRHKIKIIVLAYIIVAFLLVRFAIIPFADKIKKESDSIQEKIINNRIDEARIGEIPDMEETLESCREDSDALEVILDPRKEVDFIKQLESIADATGNRVTLSVADNNTKEGPKKSSSDKEKSIEGDLRHKNYVPMSIKLKGSYSGLVRFIHKLENTNYYVNIISIESGKITEEVSSELISVPVTDMFSNPDFSEGTEPEPVITKYKKEILESTIKIIIYTEE